MADRVIVGAFDTQNQAYDAARAPQALSDAAAFEQVMLAPGVVCLLASALA